MGARRDTEPAYLIIMVSLPGCIEGDLHELEHRVSSQ